MPHFSHHGAVRGFTGSCHRLGLPDCQAVLMDCGLFQGAETLPDGASAGPLKIDFSRDKVRALVVAHAHIDHVGRISYLLAAGFKGPVYCSQASAQLLPLMLEDALEMGLHAQQQPDQPISGAAERPRRPLPYKH